MVRAFIAVLILAAIAMQIWGSHASLDMKYYYTTEEARAFLRSVDQRAYFINELIDLVFLSAYSALFFVLSKPRWVGLIPGAFDLVETLTIIAMLTQHFDPPVWLGFMTCAKWTSGAVVVLLRVSRSLK